VKDGDNVLDVGCGTGSLIGALLDVGPTMRVTGIDGSANFVEISRRNFADSRLQLDQGDAQTMPYSDNSFDKCISLLVLNFIPDSMRAVEEMKRVTRKGGTVTAAVWDYGDGMEMLRYLWDEAVNIDETAAPKHEGNMPLCQQRELAVLWEECGLRTVTEKALTIQMDFTSFDDYWAPFLTGIGPSGSYVSSLASAPQAKLKERLRQKLAKGSDETAFSLKAKVWAVRGEVG
jgi:SAM-dependent methyltransferase